MANALLTGVRRGRWDGAAADTAFRPLMTLPVEMADLPEDVEHAWELSRRYDEHPVHDMLYLAPAEMSRWPNGSANLVTADERLRAKLESRGSVTGLDE